MYLSVWDGAQYARYRAAPLLMMGIKALSIKDRGRLSQANRKRMVRLLLLSQTKQKGLKKAINANGLSHFERSGTDRVQQGAINAAGHGRQL